MIMDTENYKEVVEKDCAEVRMVLMNLGYEQPLSHVSTPLVKQLLSDLAKAKEQLNATKQHSEKNSECVSISGSETADGVRAIIESNMIHQKIIRLKETSDLKLKEKQSALEQLSSQLCKEKMINTTLSDKVYDLQVENNEMSDRLREWQTNNMNAIVHTDSPHKISGKAQKIELTSLIPSASVNMSNSYLPARPCSYDHKNEVLRLAEERIQDLVLEMDRLRAIADTSEGVMIGLQHQINARDREINRLGRLIADQCVLARMDMEESNCLTSSLKKEMDRLLTDNNALREHIRVLEAEMRRYQDRDRDTAVRNRALETRLDNFTKQVKKLEAEKKAVQTDAEREVRTAKMELMKATTELSRVSKRVAEIERQHMQNKLRSAKAIEEDNRELEELMAVRNHQKKKLLDRIEKLGVRNDRLHSAEKERVKSQHSQDLRARIKKLEELLTSVECDRDHWKKVAYDLERRLRNRMDSGYLSHKRNKNEPYVISVESELNPSTCCADFSPSAASPLRPDSQLRSENITLRKELQKSIDEIERLSRKVAPGNKSTVERLKLENDKLREERDNMRSLMDKFERHLSEIQGNVKVLTHERDSVKRLYEETNNELRRARNETVEAGAKGSRQSALAQSIVRRLEDEKEQTMADLLRMTTERDSLKERLRTQTENGLSEKAHLQQCVEDAHSKLRRSEALITELTGITNEVRERAEMLDSTNQELQEQIKDMAREKDAEVTRRRGLEGQMEELLAELTSNRDSINKLELDNEALRAELNEMTEQHHSLNEHANRLEHDLNSERELSKRLTNQVEALETEIQENNATERELREIVSRTEAELHNEERNSVQLQNTLAAIEEQIVRAEDLATAQSQDINELTKGRESLTSQNSALKSALEESRKERMRLMDDLSTMQRANGDLQNEIQETAEAREHFRQLVDQNRSTLRQAEEMLRQKEMKLCDLSDQLRSQRCENDAQRTQILDMENQLSGLQEIVSEKQHAIANKNNIIQRMEEESKETCVVLEQLQDECESQRRLYAGLEAQLKDLVDEKERLLVDLTAIRELASQLEMTKSSVEHQLEMVSSENHEHLSVNKSLEEELGKARESLTIEKRNSAHMEGLLAAAEETEYSQQLEIEKRLEELSAARERLDAADMKQHDLARELGRVRARNAELEDDMERITKSIMHEPETDRDTKRCSHGCYHTPECLNQLTVGPHDPSTCDHGCLHSDDCRQAKSLSRMQISCMFSGGENLSECQ